MKTLIKASRHSNVQLNRYVVVKVSVLIIKQYRDNQNWGEIAWRLL